MNFSKIPHKVLSEVKGTTATMYLYGVIGQSFDPYYEPDKVGQDITDIAFLKALKQFEADGIKRLDVRINSVGGSMRHMDGIMSLMAGASMEVHTWVDGIAASAAADIFLSVPKERRHMASNSKLMIHVAQGGCYGTALQLRACAEMLDTFSEGAIAKTAADTGMTEEEVRSKYYDGADHWISAKQAAELGFVLAVEAYNAENMPPEPEKMSYLELFKFYEPTKEAERSFLEKIIAAVTPQKVAAEPVSPLVKIDEKMNIENFKASFGKDISEDEITKCLNELGFDVTKKAEPAAAPAVDVSKAITEAVAAAMKPLQDKIESLEKLLDTTPGSGPTPAKATGDPTTEEEAELTPEIKAAQDNFAKKLQSEKRGGDW